MVLGKLTPALSRYYPSTKQRRWLLLGILGVLVVCLLAGVSLWKKPGTATSYKDQNVETQLSAASASASHANPTPTPTTIPSPSVKSPLKILFGIGSQAGPAMDYKIVREAPVHMLTSWYNGPSDLEWMRVQKNDAIKRVYAKGYVVHLITWTDPQYSEVQTSHGPACGTPYPVSAQILDDMKQLAQIWAGPGSMYVTLFTEFQTYTCTNNTWNGNENYYMALKDNFRKIKDIFHQYAPGSKVAMSWGGGLSRYDDPTNQAGLSFMSHFDDVMKESDFASFQAMESDTNIQVMLDMTSILSKFGKPIMLSHYKPANNSQEVFDNDIHRLFTDSVIQQLTGKGLFAFSFMDNENINNSEATYQTVKAGIAKYGR